MLHTHHITSFRTRSGLTGPVTTTFQLFGLPLGTAPVVLVNHALTGNSAVSGEKGWWSDLIGPNCAIDTNHFTVLAIDIPGNGYDGQAHHLIEAYKHFNNADIARVQYDVVKALGITKLFAVIGGSLGGQIAWEFAAQHPTMIEHLIPIATDWKATDWVIAQCHIQEQLLCNSQTPIEDARRHAMTFYRTPASFKEKFKRGKQSTAGYQVQSWLDHHGNLLKNRFALQSYKLMNHLLLSADITGGAQSFQDTVCDIEATVHLVAIDTDGLFLADEIYDTFLCLKELGLSASYNEIHSIHGHDAFLIEYAQLSAIVKPIFQKQLCHK